jgi:hypothetical protein
LFTNYELIFATIKLAAVLVLELEPVALDREKFLISAVISFRIAAFRHFDADIIDKQWKAEHF